MKMLRGSEEAVSPVIGVVLMVGLTVIMISAVAVSVFAAFTPLENAPQAKIVIVETRGNEGTLRGNEIVLVHKGGDTLYSGNVKIVIRGEGKEALKGEGDYTSLGKIVIIYRDLKYYNYVGSGERKDSYFLGYDDLEYAKIVQGDAWSAGKKVVLYGADGAHSWNTNNVDKKWKLKPSSSITITLIDIPTNQVIAVTSAKVKGSGEVVGS